MTKRFVLCNILDVKFYSWLDRELENFNKSNNGGRTMIMKSVFASRTVLVLSILGFVLMAFESQALVTVTKQIVGLDPNGYFVNGVTTQLQITVTINYDGTEGRITALGYEETVPAGFTYTGTPTGPNPPAVTPNEGQSGTLGFAYIFVPSFPASFTYTLNCPSQICDPEQLVGKALYRTTGPQLESGPVVNVIQLEPTSLSFTRSLGGPGITGSNNNFYIPGEDIYITITITKEGPQQITALGFQDTLPNNWTYVGLLSRTSNPELTPSEGTTDLVEFGYITIPTFPVSFTYVVHVPDGYSGPVVIGGNKVIGSETKHSAVLYRTCGGPLESPKVETALEGAVPCLIVTRTFPNGNYYIPGQNVLVQINIRINPEHPCSATVTALGYQETIPDGWVYQSVGGPNPPQITPPDPDGPVLDFGYITVPNLSGAGATFTYTIRASQSSSGPQQFSGRGLYRVGASGELKTDYAISEIVSDAPPVITLNGNAEVTIECGTEYVDAGATATDIPDGDLTDRIQVTNNVNSQEPGDYTVEYSVTDSTNHTTTAQRIVHVVDTVKPVINLLGDNPLIVECKAVFTDPGAEVIDACDTNLQAQVSGTVNTNVVGDYVLVYTATDSSGNSAEPVQRLVRVVDTRAPLINLIGANPLTLQCGVSYVEPGATAVDSCAGNLTVNVNSSQVNTQEPGTYTVYYRAVDPSGNTGTAQRTVVVQDTLPPVITIVGANPLIVQCGSAFTDPGATAVDQCDGTVQVQSSGAVNTAEPGEYQITYTAQDSRGLSTRVTRTVRVVDTLPPTITLNQSQMEIECGDVFVDPGAIAGDQCDGSVNLLASAYEIYDNVNGWVVVDRIDTSNVGVQYRAKYEYTDSSGNPAVPKYTLIRIVDTTPPVITLAEDELLLECGDVFEDPGATAVDTCNNIVRILTAYAIYLAEGMYKVESIDSTTVGVEYIVSYVAEDSQGNRAEKDMRVWVVDTTPPSMQLIGANPLEIECGGVFGDPGAIASDVCDGVQQYITAQLIYSVYDAYTMYLVDKVETSNPGRYMLLYRAHDANGNMAEVTRDVRVVDTTPPVITLNGESEVVLECGVGGYEEAGAVARDACDGDVQVVVNGAVNVGEPGNYEVRYTASDTSGNSSQVVRTVRVVDTTPPVITLNGESEVVLECGVGGYEEAGAVARDACDGDVQVVVNGAVNVGEPGNYEVRYTASDTSGNSSQVVRTVRVVDTTPPVVTLNGPAEVQIDQGTQYEELGAVATDACAGELPVVIGGDVVNTSVPGTYIVTYTATDSASLSTTVQRRVVVKEVVVEGEGEVVVGRKLVIVPSPTLDFGALEIKKVYKQRVLLVNKGTADAKVYMLVKETAGGVFELQTDDTTIPVEAGTTKYVNVYFKPVKPGKYEGKVLFVVADETAPAEERYVTLLGEGKKPKRRILGISCGDAGNSVSYAGDLLFIALTVGTLLVASRRRRPENS